MQDFRHLETWQVAHALTLNIYRVTDSFPRSELYGITSNCEGRQYPLQRMSRRARVAEPIREPGTSWKSPRAQPLRWSICSYSQRTLASCGLQLTRTWNLEFRA